MNTFRKALKPKLKQMMISFLLLGVVLFPTTIYAGSSALTENGRKLTTKPPSKEAVAAFEKYILPGIKDVMAQDVESTDGILIKRKLIYWELIRYEIFRGRDTYYVHIEFEVTAIDNSQQKKQKILMGQEILFIMKEDVIVKITTFAGYPIKEEEVESIL